MTDAKPRTKLSAAQLRPLLPVLAVVLLLAAAWLAWTGWQQARDAGRAQSLEQSRDLAAQSTARALSQQQERLQQRLASIDLALVQSDQDIDVLDYRQRNAIAWAAALTS